MKNFWCLFFIFGQAFYYMTLVYLKLFYVTKILLIFPPQYSCFFFAYISIEVFSPRLDHLMGSE